MGLEHIHHRKRLLDETSQSHVMFTKDVTWVPIVIIPELEGWKSSTASLEQRGVKIPEATTTAVACSNACEPGGDEEKHRCSDEDRNCNGSRGGKKRETTTRG